MALVLAGEARVRFPQSFAALDMYFACVVSLCDILREHKESRRSSWDKTRLRHDGARVDGVVRPA